MFWPQSQHSDFLSCWYWYWLFFRYYRFNSQKNLQLCFINNSESDEDEDEKSGSEVSKHIQGGHLQKQLSISDCFLSLVPLTPLFVSVNSSQFHEIRGNSFTSWSIRDCFMSLLLLCSIRFCSVLLLKVFQRGWGAWRPVSRVKAGGAGCVEDSAGSAVGEGGEKNGECIINSKPCILTTSMETLFHLKFVYCMFTWLNEWRMSRISGTFFDL